MLIERARENTCDGVICGHIHTPRIADYGGLLYCNTGDWVENCTALVEYDDGALEIVHPPAEMQEAESLAYVAARESREGDITPSVTSQGRAMSYT